MGKKTLLWGLFALQRTRAASPPPNHEGHHPTGMCLETPKAVPLPQGSPWGRGGATGTPEGARWLGLTRGQQNAAVPRAGGTGPPLRQAMGSLGSPLPLSPTTQARFSPSPQPPVPRSCHHPLGIPGSLLGCSGVAGTGAPCLKREHFLGWGVLVLKVAEEGQAEASWAPAALFWGLKHGVAAALDTPSTLPHGPPSTGVVLGCPGAPGEPCLFFHPLKPFTKSQP